MDFKKMSLLAAVLVSLCLCGGCRMDGMWDETEARRWYEEMQGKENWKETVPGGGVYSTMEDVENNAERNTYGMRTDDDGIKENIRNIQEDFKR